MKSNVFLYSIMIAMELIYLLALETISNKGILRGLSVLHGIC